MKLIKILLSSMFVFSAVIRDTEVGSCGTRRGPHYLCIRAHYDVLNGDGNVVAQGYEGGKDWPELQRYIKLDLKQRQITADYNLIEIREHRRLVEAAKSLSVQPSRRTENNMFDDDDGLTVGKVVFIGFLLVLAGFLLKGCVSMINESAAIEAAWCQKHNTTSEELEIFARVMNVSANDVMSSKGLQAEFERFERGDLRQTGQETIHHGKTSETRNTFS